jgi:hypothetical protein
MVTPTRPTLLLLLACAVTRFAHADSAPSLCGYSEREGVEPASYNPCIFSQRQGHINIYRDGEDLHQFSPDGDQPGVFLDAAGNRVYRKRGLGDKGQLFQLPARYLYVLWDPVPTQFECQAEELKSATGCTLGDGRVGFRLQATSGSSLNQLVLQPLRLTNDNRSQEVELDGTAYLAELADLDSNGWPEIYVYISSAGSGSYGSLVAYAVNQGKSATPVYLPPLPPELAAGYQGHDEFRVVETTLVRRFPLYEAGDTNATPSGQTRQLQYKLRPGEAGWRLELDRSVDY